MLILCCVFPTIKEWTNVVNDFNLKTNPIPHTREYSPIHFPIFCSSLNIAACQTHRLTGWNPLCHFHLCQCMWSTILCTLTRNRALSHNTHIHVLSLKYSVDWWLTLQSNIWRWLYLKLMIVCITDLVAHWNVKCPI